jgi:putative flippase GtrA
MSSAIARLRYLVGLLRSPDSGLPGLTGRFALAGGFGAIVYVLITTLMADVVGLPFQVALGLGFCTALCINFLSQRRFVWAKPEPYVLPIHRQAGRYVFMACMQYGVIAGVTLLLPRALGLPTEVVYLAMVGLLGLINFLILRRGIFHSVPASSETETRSHRSKVDGIPDWPPHPTGIGPDL